MNDSANGLHLRGLRWEKREIMPDINNGVEKILTTKYMGRPFIYMDTTESTQNEVTRYALGGADEGLAVGAGYQSQGRGRLDREWLSTEGSSILVSILLKPEKRYVNHIVVMAALGLESFIKQIDPNIPVSIKWPNDILIEGKKVAGILVERTPAHQTGMQDIVVLGMGVNMNLDTSKISEIASISTSLYNFTGKTFDLVNGYATLFKNLEAHYELLKNGTDLFSEWKNKLITLGRTVKITDGEEEIEGLAKDVDETGSLIVQRKDGTKFNVIAGDAHLLN